MIDLTKLGLGYAVHLENLPALQSRSTAFDGRNMCRSMGQLPKSMTCRTWRKKAKYQGMMGSCSGFSRSSAGEILHYFATHGKEVLQFSGMFCYLENQKQDGTYGQGDGGASIDGSMKASEATGYCLESAMPYTQAMLDGQYTRETITIPPGAESSAVANLTRRHSVMQGYDDCHAWLATGQGCILTGTPWLEGMTRVQRLTDISDLYGQLLGWHARVLTGYDESGNLEDENSHGQQFADGGWDYLTPRLVDRWIQKDGATFIGISDMAVPGPRHLTDLRGMGG